MIRCIFTCCFVCFGAVAMFCAASGVANGEMLLFHDSFDTSESQGVTGTGSNINFEIETRTTGKYGGAEGVQYAIPFHVDPNYYPTIGADDGDRKVMTAYKNYWGGLDYNFNNEDSAGGLDIDLTAKLTDCGDNLRAILVGVGNDVAYGLGSGYHYRPNGGGFSFVFEAGGDIRVLEDGSDTESSGNYSWITGGNDEQYHTFHLEVRGVGDDNPFNGLGQVNVSIYVDGVYKAEYTSSAGFDTSNNYVGLDRYNSFNSFIDEWSITQVVPEPSSLAMLGAGLIGLLAYAWRKRT